jgi:Nucleotidyl transferase AbiEii toxin, Type IV TA system
MFYLDLFSKLQQFEVQYLLIGGLAVSLHGVERATMDIDITVAMQPNNLDKLIACAESLDLKPVLPVPLASLKNLELLKQWHQEKNLLAFALRTEELAGVTLDILLFPPIDFDNMQQRMTKFDIANTAVNVVCIDDLIALKQAAGRAIDLSDIEHLNKIKSL